MSFLNRIADLYDEQQFAVIETLFQLPRRIVFEELSH